MIQIIIWLGMLVCTNPAHTPQSHGDCNLVHMPGVTTFDIGGETGGNPKPPPPPPPVIPGT
jgi:hypothetical protein